MRKREKVYHDLVSKGWVLCDDYPSAKRTIMQYPADYSCVLQMEFIPKYCTIMPNGKVMIGHYPPQN